MSGGTYNYAYLRIEELAAGIRRTTPLRKAFVTHLVLVARAAHDIEWVDSDDCSPGDEDPAIRAALSGDVDALVLKEATSDARQALDALQAALAAAEGHVLDNGGRLAPND